MEIKGIRKEIGMDIFVGWREMVVFEKVFLLFFKVVIIIKSISCLIIVDSE